MNKTVLAILACTVALAGCLAAYWFLIGDSGEHEAAAVADTSAKPTASAPKSERDERGDAAGQGQPTVLFDDDPRGSLQLEGRVVRGDGDDGVDGALVSIDSNPPRSVRTESDGSFEFSNLIGRNYRIIARHADGVAGPEVAKLTESNDPVILKIRRAATVRVTVVSATSSAAPISNANVELRGIDRLSVATNGDGVASFAMVAPDRYEVVASAPGFAPTHERLRVPRSGGSVDVQLALKTGAAVSGFVVDHRDQPVENARVVYVGASEWSQRASPRWDAAVTDAKGRFAFPALMAGSFRFTAVPSGARPE